MKPAGMLYHVHTPTALLVSHGKHIMSLAFALYVLDVGASIIQEL